MNLRETVSALIDATIQPLGYALISVEFLTSRERKLRIHIEKSDGKAVGIEDCVRVTKTLDQPLESSPDVNALYPNSYELEVSSPGINRPLVKPADFERFKGQRVRIHTFRPLQAQELKNPEFANKFPKQKNFVGTLGGLHETCIELQVEPNERVEIPHVLVAKACLEPDLNTIRE